MRTSFAAPAYRADIDGLRAIAVLSVMAFHAHDAALPGGFVGVDIFFVISGYLISRHIAEETASQQFSLLEFYWRRIRRIMPMQVNARLRQLAGRMPGVYYFDANRYLCPDGRCPEQTASGEPRFIDASHLTVSASAELGRAILAAEGIPSALIRTHPDTYNPVFPRSVAVHTP